MATVWQLAHAHLGLVGAQRSILPQPLGMVIPKSCKSAPRLIMEEGGIDLFSLLVRPPSGRRLTIDERRQIIFHIVHHVLFLWQAFGMVHLDLKPHNIMVGHFRHPHKPLRVWLVDWGASATLDRLLDRPLETHVTTIWFEAPEAILGLPQAGLPQDKWSLGCVLWSVCFFGHTPAAGSSYIEHFWQQCRLFGTPSEAEPPWDLRATSRRAVRFAPRWPRGGAALRAKRAAMNKIWNGLGDLVVDGLLQMDPQRRWATRDIARHFALRLPHRQGWRFMYSHPVVPWQPTQRAARRLMMGHTVAECNPMSERKARMVLVEAMLEPLNGMFVPDDIHPMLPVFAIRLLDTAVRRILPFGWRHRHLVLKIPQFSSWVVAPSPDAMVMVQACFMIALKWFCESTVDSDTIADLFSIPSRRAITRVVELERDIVRACPDLLGLEGQAMAFRKLERRLARNARGHRAIAALGSMLLMHAMLFLPALWKFTRSALLRDIQQIQTHIIGSNATWKPCDLKAQFPWLRSKCAWFSLHQKPWVRRHDLRPDERRWLYHTFDCLVVEQVFH